MLNLQVKRLTAVTPSIRASGAGALVVGPLVVMVPALIGRLVSALAPAPR